MRFGVRDEFKGVTLADFATLSFDEPFNEELCAAVRMERQLVLREVSEHTLVREVLVFPERTLPKAVQKIVGEQRVGYTERIEFDFQRHAGTFVCRPTAMGDRVACEGSISLSVEADHGVVRTVEGEVRVKLFGLGSVIERFVVADVERSYREAAEFTRRYLAQRRGRPRDP